MKASLATCSLSAAFRVRARGPRKFYEAIEPVGLHRAGRQSGRRKVFIKFCPGGVRAALKAATALRHRLVCMTSRTVVGTIESLLRRSIRTPGVPLGARNSSDLDRLECGPRRGGPI